MKVILKFDADNVPIGWDMIPETSEDDTVIATVRDLTFFGLNETEIVYEGLTLKDDSLGRTEGNIAKLSWIQKCEQVNE